jgi:hypothetical protein
MRFAAELNHGKHTAYEKQVAEFVSDLYVLLKGKRPTEVAPPLFRALKDRWGVGRTNVVSIAAAAQSHDVDVDDLLDADISLVERFGFRIELSRSQRIPWQRLTTPVKKQAS